MIPTLKKHIKFYNFFIPSLHDEIVIVFDINLQAGEGEETIVMKRKSQSGLQVAQPVRLTLLNFEVLRRKRKTQGLQL